MVFVGGDDADNLSTGTISLRHDRHRGTITMTDTFQTAAETSTDVLETAGWTNDLTNRLPFNY